MADKDTRPTAAERVEDGSWMDWLDQLHARVTKLEDQAAPATVRGKTKPAEPVEPAAETKPAG